MRELSQPEKEILFKKLSKYIGHNTKHLLETDDELHVFRWHKQRVYYMPQNLLKLASSFAADEIINPGTCIGKFTKAGAFRINITSLDVIAPHIIHKIKLKKNAENSFLYGKNIHKAQQQGVSANTIKNEGILVTSAAGVPLGFGTAARSAVEFKTADQLALVVYHQADVAEYIRHEETLT